MQITNVNELQGTTTPISICMFRISLHFLDWILVGEIQVPPKFPSQLWQPQLCHGSWKVKSLKFGSQFCDVFRNGRIQPEFLPRHSPLRQISSQMSTSMPQLSTVKAKHQDHPTLRLLPRNCKRCIIIWTTSPSKICIIQLSWRNSIESTSRMSSVLFDQWNEDVWGLEDQPDMAPKTHNLAKTHRPWRPCPWNWNMNQKYSEKGMGISHFMKPQLWRRNVKNWCTTCFLNFQFTGLNMTPLPNLCCRCDGDHGEIKSTPPTCDFFHDTWKTTRNPSCKKMDNHVFLCWPLWTPTLRNNRITDKNHVVLTTGNCTFAWISWQFLKVTWLHHGAHWSNDLNVQQQIYQRIL